MCAASASGGYYRGPAPASAGVGLRAPHYQALREAHPPLGFLEIHPENYFGGGKAIETLEYFSQHYPLSFHCVGLSLGSSEKVDAAHLDALAALAERFSPVLISDHVSWSMSGNAHLNDLLPLPYTEETLSTVSGHIAQVQDRLGRAILVENPSTYLAFGHSTMPEPEFMAQLAHNTGCGLLLDVNNIFVQLHNNGGDVESYLAALEGAPVGEIHLAGHTEQTLGDTKTLLIDTHNRRVREEVWAFYEKALRQFGPTPTMIEWDRDLPELSVLLEEAAKADAVCASVCGKARRYAAG